MKHTIENPENRGQNALFHDHNITSVSILVHFFETFLLNLHPEQMSFLIEAIMLYLKFPLLSPLLLLNLHKSHFPL